MARHPEGSSATGFFIAALFFFITVFPRPQWAALSPCE
jgi:hypothetical protein